MPATPAVQRIHQDKSQPKGGEKKQLHKNAVAYPARDLRWGTLSAKNPQVIQTHPPAKSVVPRSLGAVGHLPVTHSKVIFTSSLVTIFPVGSCGAGGAILKSLIFSVVTPLTVSLLPARAMVTGMVSGFFTP